MQCDSFAHYELQTILSETDYTKRATKIICTIGPACWDVSTLVQLIDAGMSVARLNFSHGDHKVHGETVAKLREAFKQRKEKPVAIALDTKGPEIRTGLNQEHKQIILKKGQKLEITTDYTFEGTSECIACSYQSLCKTVHIGSQILIADGTVVTIVDEIKEFSVIVTVQNEASFGEKKNMSLPGAIIDLPTVTEKEEEDLVKFGLKHNIDIIFLSFTRKAQDIEDVRDILGPRGSGIKIIAKIENQEGMQNYDEILKSADGIMVARGDLGMEIPPQKVFQAQKWMIKRALDVGKPVITATQMMESIITNPRPTRAEASDVANAVLDGTDCVMLSGETANGAFPVIAVETMGRICCEAEKCVDHEKTYWNRIHDRGQLGDKEALAASAVQMSFETKAHVIICFTLTGEIARLVAKYRPRAPIIAISTEDKTIKGLSMTSGVTCLRVPSFQGVDTLVDYAIKSAKTRGIIKTGDKGIVLLGGSEDNPDESNILKVKKIN
ncbi:unnamed protein product [Paramecium primaurelia]|uniref:pyruvate kinase n=1 Tax=Paramecium primaurelia TaxID=5886 RepID=A0A8S1LAP2_PARPR|nr:unnamed protein product [Paramecium primaurelia]